MNSQIEASDSRGPVNSGEPDAPGGSGHERGVPEALAGLVSLASLEPRHLVRLPDPESPGIEGLAGEANRRRVADASTRLEQVVPGLVAWLDAQVDSSETPTVVPARVPVDADAAWVVLDTVLRHDDARAGRVAVGLEAAGGTVDDQLQFDTTYEIHRANIGQLAEKLASQVTLVARAVERHCDSLLRLAADLTTVLGQLAHVDLVAFGPEAVHVDAGNRGGGVVVLPVDNALSAIVTIPRNGDAATQRVGSVSPEVNVAPGQAILVDRSHTLRVTSDTLGIALRLVLPVLDPATLRLQTSATARFHPLLRADLPTDLDETIESYGGSLYDRPGAFHAEASMALAAVPQEHAAAWLRAALPPQPRQGLLEARRARHDLPPDLVAPLSGGVMVTTIQQDVVLAAGGLVVTLAPEVARLLVPHLDGRAFDPTPVLRELRTVVSSHGGSVAGYGHATPDAVGAETMSLQRKGQSGQKVVPEIDPVLAALHLLLSFELLEVAP